MGFFPREVHGLDLAALAATALGRLGKASVHKMTLMNITWKNSGDGGTR